MPSFALFDLYEKPVAICISFNFSQLRLLDGYTRC